MPCDSWRFTPRQTEADRKKQIAEKLKRLEEKLKLRAIGVVIGPQGALTFQNWSDEDRAGITDVCAFRALERQGSLALRQAIERAESLYGRKVDRRMIAAGIHSHDGGKTWDKGH